jgi:Na+:H+ antiporter, NhaA family
MTTEEPPLSHSWLSSDAAVARLVARPMRRFLATEAGGGIVLLVAVFVALVLANSPFSTTYESLWSTKISIGVGDFELSHDVRHWINDGLMTIFFFLVGLEIKRELVAGELREPRRAALPAIAALGGMVVPALIYVAINVGGDGLSGWGVPMATDIAFAVGVLTLLGKNCPSNLKVLLLSIAIVDDIGAILVIAVFYTDEIALEWLIAAYLLVGLTIALRHVRVWWTPIYVVVGSALWLSLYESGVHATLAGVVLGLIAPALPADPEGVGDAITEVEHLADDPDPELIRRTTIQAQELVSVAERLELMLHPWSSFFIIPVFALANAGVRLSIKDVSEATSSPVVLGIVLGLVVGKLVGISAAAWLSVRFRIGELPEGLRWSHVVGCGAIAGIGFTVALFIADLAFGEGEMADEAKIGILVGSALAASVGVLLLRRAATREEAIT